MDRRQPRGDVLAETCIDNRISILARSPGLAAERVECVVTVPTFRRPGPLLGTLRSLAAQRTSRRFAVIVMENEAELRQGAAASSPLFSAGDLHGLVLVAHERGNCCAYNAGWTTALAEFPNLAFLAVIDDDEMAAPDWLENLHRAAETLEVDIVGGPQVPVFDRSEHARLADHPVFAPPYRESGPVRALYSSGNLLLARAVLDAMPRPFLDPKFNFTGGGDSDFLSRAAHKGFRLGWCAEAVIRETMPARRAEADWIRARALRNGVISTWVDKRRRAGEAAGRAKVLAKSLALLGLAPARGLKLLMRTGSLSAAMYPVYVGLGRVLAEFGYANEQYRQPEKN